MATWAEATDVTGSWIGDDAPTDTTLVDTWIGKAEREIRRRVPDLQSRIDAEVAQIPAVTDLKDTAVDVVVAMVTRVFRNPEGVRQGTTTSGPFTDLTTYTAEAAAGLALTDAELAKLASTAATGAFSIGMIPSTSPFFEG